MAAASSQPHGRIRALESAPMHPATSGSALPPLPAGTSHSAAMTVFATSVGTLSTGERRMASVHSRGSAATTSLAGEETKNKEDSRTVNDEFSCKTLITSAMTPRCNALWHRHNAAHCVHCLSAPPVAASERRKDSLEYPGRRKNSGEREGVHFSQRSESNPVANTTSRN